jgi:lipopolysaccharide transport system ATP-binding protein
MVAIRAEGLGKCYRVTQGQERSRYRTLRESLTDLAAGMFRRASSGGRPRRGDEFWALRDVSFEVRPGEVVGVIGRNGAGKSTLLKILSRITKPTRGQAEVRGRVGSLLEVGTGFHPELTGRENIYLSGSILGMSSKEITRRFDEIVAFAEVERFLDTPVKRYSSGMYVRLAFAVAAHLDPDILIIDEVLAVGDAAFQKKCLGKIGEVGGSHRAVLIVSHQIQAIQAMTSRSILLDKGCVVRDGRTSEVVADYLGRQGAAGYDLSTLPQEGSAEARFLEMSVAAGGRNGAARVVQGEPLDVCFTIEAKTVLRAANISMAVRNATGIELFSHAWSDVRETFAAQPGRHAFRVRIPTQYLRAGPYWLTLCVCKEHVEVVSVIRGIELPTVELPEDCDTLMESRRWGVVHIPCEWDRA